MKNIVLLASLVLIVSVCRSQTYDEWFRQKKTQEKYLLQQISAFQLYSEYVQKGYSIAKKGLTTIGNIKKGDFNLHSVFFNSLISVNPAIRKSTKVADIIAYQVKIIETYKAVYKHVQSSNLFNTDDINYIHRVFNSINNYSVDEIEELISVISSNNVEMKDDQRIKRIDEIYRSIKEKYVFVKSFSDDLKVLGGERIKEKNNVQESRRIYDVND